MSTQKRSVEKAESPCELCNATHGVRVVSTRAHGDVPLCASCAPLARGDDDE